MIPADWNPEDAASFPGLFGLPHGPEDARIHVLPVPWDATCSYGRGTRFGPEAVRRASAQLDLFDPDLGEAWRQGIWLADEDPKLVALNAEASRAVDRLLGEDVDDDEMRRLAERVDLHSAERSRHVEAWTAARLDEGRVPAVLGGDHSSPLGAIRAAAARGPLSILHVDAHLDLREAFEGFAESHASIFFNVLAQCPGVERLVQVGVRDFGRTEWERATGAGERVTAWPMRAWRRRLLAGEAGFAELCAEAVAPLGERLWISVDIDGLDAPFCPGTGTPVPGGLSYAELETLLAVTRASGRRVVGFDLCEVAGRPAAELDAAAPEDRGRLEWDANVGARVLYRLCGAAVDPAGDRA